MARVKGAANLLAVAYLCAVSGSLAKLPPPPPPLTNDEKVTQSDYIVVGDAQKLVYFETIPGVPFGQVEFDSDAPIALPHRGALLEVHVTDVLCQKKDIPPKLIRVYLPGDFKSASERRALYLNKQLIYFLKREEVRTGDKTESRYWFIRGPRASGAPVSVDRREELQPYIDKYCAKH